MPNELGKKAILNDMREACGPDNGHGLTEAHLRELSDSLWTWASSGAANERLVRLRNNIGGLPGHLLELAGPDLPFLVDSILGECRAQSVRVDTFFHPIIARNKAEEKADQKYSVMQFHLPALVKSALVRLEAGIRETLEHVDLIVGDHKAMLSRMFDEVKRLADEKHIESESRSESLAFLEWLANDHFVFLGVRTYEYDIQPDGSFACEEPEIVEGTNLGLLRDETRDVLSRDDEPTMLTGLSGSFLNSPEPLIIAKSILVSRVHRRARADYVGVKHYDAKGRVVGETRFLGLFTAEAYLETVRSVPLIRRRAEQVLAGVGAQEGGHTEKMLIGIMENWPRDELLQTDAQTLLPMVSGVMHLLDRPRTRVFLRYDPFGRFLSALVYVPRDAYDSDLRRRVVALLESEYEGSLLRFDPRFDVSSLVRLHIQLAIKPDGPKPDEAGIEARLIELATRWEDVFVQTLQTSELSEAARDGASLFENGFPVGYREVFTPGEALLDVAELAELSADSEIRMRTYKRAGDEDDCVRAKVYSRGNSLALSESVPVLENMGLFVAFEMAYRVSPSERPREDSPAGYWVHDFMMRSQSGEAVDLEANGAAFQDAFAAIWTEQAENDGFNKLIFSAGVDWREADLLRGLSAYRRQSGLDPVRASQIRAFVSHPAITRNLIALFNTLFDPSGEGTVEERLVAGKRLLGEIHAQLGQVPSLEDDRVLRRTAALIMAIQRTNYFQPNARPLAFKVASQELEDLPKPVPYREIFVTGPTMDGVHLRFGAVARGGLRWSDRADDFRTEVLGLVKAQQVKNAVIVPVGSKGGFFPKTLPIGGSREEVREAGIAAYRTFISGMLGITDTLVDGKVRHPEHTIVRDGPDPYLVVAADKGTATFSDIANEISVGQGFWLGDAFASGGSAGYDHKVMGITARGAWEAVKRHFLEAGKDIQTEPFDVIGVGDMSGDVFGNGMLLSRQIRLLAAFNHMHIFVDPNPGDPEKMWKERDRLFKLPRSGWADYNTKLISKGGGVFERSAKSIDLSDEIKALTGLSADTATPDELIHALLKAQAELLWFGGIGTYVRSTDESDRDVGDRTNDPIRVTAKELRVSVVGEGANLGITQAARIEFAQSGGRINTDAIDNSAGVDSSDHEVNIKILLSEAMAQGVLPRGERNTLLASMTDDVASHVLAHNIAQTGALSLAEATAKEDLPALERLMLRLEARGMLDRAVEGLPTSSDMIKRIAAKGMFTRPEMAVLLAWSKIALFDDIVASDLPDDPYFKPVLETYFPAALGQFSDIMQAHRLKREIIATVLANRILDVAGPIFFLELVEASGADNVACVRAYEILRAALELPALMSRITSDDTVPEMGKVVLQLDVNQRVGQMAASMLRGSVEGDMGDLVRHYTDGYTKLVEDADKRATAHESSRIERRAKQLVRAGATEKLAFDVASLGLVSQAVELIDVAASVELDVAEVSAVFNELGGTLRIDRLVSRARDVRNGMSHWERQAVDSQLGNICKAQAAATRHVLESKSNVSDYLKARRSQTDDLSALLRGLDLGRDWSFAKFALAADAVRAVLV
ncbi:MAG: NAD-glutamate dehydrogenase [Hyphomonadaceae bacterium]